MLASTRRNDESRLLLRDEPDIARAAMPRTVGTFAAGQSRLGVYEALIAAPVGSFASASGPASQASE